jgi:hypothetical protein
MVISQTRVDRTAALVDGWARLNGQILRIAVSRPPGNANIQALSRSARMMPQVDGGR